MKFADYVKRLGKPDSPEGDFIEDFMDDVSPKPDFESWDQLKRFLIFRHACPEAIEAAREVWNHYAAKDDAVAYREHLDRECRMVSFLDEAIHQMRGLGATSTDIAKTLRDVVRELEGREWRGGYHDRH